MEALGLVRWEWFKLRRRWMPWILLVIFVLIAQVALWGTGFAFTQTRETTDRIVTTADEGHLVEYECDDLLEGGVPEVDQAIARGGTEGEEARAMVAQCEQWKERQREDLGSLYSLITPPGSIVLTLGVGHTLGLLLLAVLAASVIGTEHSWGTVRLLLTRGVRRWHMLASKLVMLAVVLAGALLVASALGLVSGWLLGGLVSGTEGLESEYSWGDAAELLGRVWLSILPYGLMAVMVTVATRSSSAGIGIGMVYYFLEQLVVGVIGGLVGFSSWFQSVADFLLVYNMEAFLGDANVAGEGAGQPPGQLHSLLVMAGYGLAMGGLAFYLFLRRDIPGASRS